MTKKKSGIIQMYYNETKIKLQSKYFVFNDKTEWECKLYYSNGELWKIYNCKNNKLEGEYKSYLSNGQLEIICNYKNNKIEGGCKKYYKMVN
jgi:antitoxin component YwqK of YwqJK toxin-antitoxin module